MIIACASVDGKNCSAGHGLNTKQPEVTPMVLDPTSGAIQANVKVDRPTATVAEKPNNEVENRPEAGRASENSPAVVANISAAARETARAVNEPEQSTDQNSSNNVVERENTGQSQALREQNVTQKRQEIGEKRIDIVV